MTAIKCAHCGREVSLYYVARAEKHMCGKCYAEFRAIEASTRGPYLNGRLWPRYIAIWACRQAGMTVSEVAALWGVSRSWTQSILDDRYGGGLGGYLHYKRQQQAAEAFTQAAGVSQARNRVLDPDDGELLYVLNLEERG